MDDRGFPDACDLWGVWVSIWRPGDFGRGFTPWWQGLVIQTQDMAVARTIGMQIGQWICSPLGPYRRHTVIVQCDVGMATQEPCTQNVPGSFTRKFECP